MGDNNFEPRWRLDLDDDATVRFDPDTQTLTKVSTGESCFLGDYPSFAAEKPACLRVRSSHAPPIGKWYVTGEE
jgi:hypothetical protein